MNLKSEVVSINTDQATVQSFFTDLNNLSELLPSDRIENFSSDGKTCSFSIKGLAKIGLRLEKLDNPIVLQSTDVAPFPFTLNIFLEEADGSCNGHVTFDGEVNSFMAMMVKTPLTNFLNQLADSLKAKY